MIVTNKEVAFLLLSTLLVVAPLFDFYSGYGAFSFESASKAYGIEEVLWEDGRLDLEILLSY